MRLASANAMAEAGAAAVPATVEELYRRNGGRIFALCLRLTGSRPEAEDLTQEVFVRAYEQLGSFRGEAAISTWLYRLALNLVLSARRSELRRAVRVELQAAAACAQPALVPERGARLDLERAVAALPLGARTVLVLHDVEGLRHEEIAAQLDVTVGTSKAQLFRARKLLREALS
jgi:RNA polymerase sigma-70 factor (ECF subfamily)